MRAMDPDKKEIYKFLGIDQVIESKPRKYLN